mgnify:FL=1
MQTDNAAENVQATEEQELQPAEETKKGKEKKPVNVKKEILSWILTLGAAVIIALVIRTFLFEPVRVDGHSMDDTLANGEIMFVTKPEYLTGDPQPGDVVICHYPDRGNTNFVKRVVGVPGDTLMFVDNVLIRNGEVVDEPYLTPSRNQNGFSMLPITLGENEYFVCGDNRDNSHDCRNLTNGVPEAITRDMIIGHVRYVVYPFSDARSIN